MKWLNSVLALLALGLSLNVSAALLTDEDEMIFKDAITEGNIKVVEKFIKTEPKVVNEKFFGWSPLQMATNANQPAVMKLLIAKGADINYVHPTAVHTAFHLAALNEYKDLCTLLAKSGADVNLKLKADVSLIRYFRDRENKGMVDFLTGLGVKDDGCLEEKCF